MRKKRILDDEWWRPKRVITDLEKKAKSSYAYNNQRGIYKNRYKSVITYTKTSSKKQTEVVIKFTGSRFYKIVKILPFWEKKVKI